MRRYPDAAARSVRGTGPCPVVWSAGRLASIRRFSARISIAGALMAVTDELSAPDDRTVRFRLKRPFPHLPEALAGPGGTVPAIMPERLAAESPYKPTFSGFPVR